ncbi:hypothetical protein [Flavobacterium pectinovorum]|uniref:hypothetical protein n=1 Tax=Flavobacterium pectinovorum TaxID=29533 RepID=UPI001FAD2C8B|nr:hypothetical protein [Flavobacterium pectinovorum]MCI9844776.1 hypothetical protein [Flavobacterium pectinovorum]
MKNINKIQNLLPLGYLFLVILGIVKESIFYYQIGINIIRYSSVMDILISPIAMITYHPLIFIFIVVLFIFYSKLPQILLKNEDKKRLHKLFGSTTIKTELSENERLGYYNNIAIESLSFFLISIFLGYGLADGKFTSENIKNNNIEYTYKLNYSDEKSENVYIIGSNTAYYFYLSEGNANIKIVPVNSIRNLELINNKMLNK